MNALTHRGAIAVTHNNQALRTPKTERENTQNDKLHRRLSIVAFLATRPMTDNREAQTDGQRPWLLPPDEFVELVSTTAGLPSSSRTRQWPARRRQVELDSGQHGAIESNTSAAASHMGIVESNSTTDRGHRVGLDNGPGHLSSSTRRWSYVLALVHRRVRLNGRGSSSGRTRQCRDALGSSSSPTRQWPEALALPGRHVRLDD